MFARIMGFLKLDINVIEEVEADESATSQAAVVVAVVAVFAAIGAFLAAQAGNAAISTLTEQFGGLDVPIAVPEISAIGAAVNALLGAILAWLIWSALTYLIGTRLFNGQATMGEMLRVLGFAQAPRLLSVLNFIPCLGPLLAFVAWVWALVVGFVAIRQGLDLDNGKTAITVVLSLIAAIMVNLFVIGPISALLF